MVEERNILHHVIRRGNCSGELSGNISGDMSRGMSESLSVGLYGHQVAYIQTQSNLHAVTCNKNLSYC